MSDAVLTLLKFGLLGSLYAFFAWVLWVALSQIRAPATVAAPIGVDQGARSHQAERGQITIVEPPELHGSVMSVGDELSIGRAVARMQDHRPDNPFAIDECAVG